LPARKGTPSRRRSSRARESPPGNPRRPCRSAQSRALPRLVAVGTDGFRHDAGPAAVVPIVVIGPVKDLGDSQGRLTRGTGTELAAPTLGQHGNSLRWRSGPGEHPHGPRLLARTPPGFGLRPASGFYPILPVRATDQPARRCAGFPQRPAGGVQPIAGLVNARVGTHEMRCLRIAAS
jgi:hypothetical protein